MITESRAWLTRTQVGAGHFGGYTQIPTTVFDHTSQEPQDVCPCAPNLGKRTVSGLGRQIDHQPKTPHPLCLQSPVKGAAKSKGHHEAPADKKCRQSPRSRPAVPPVQHKRWIQPLSRNRLLQGGYDSAPCPRLVRSLAPDVIFSIPHNGLNGVRGINSSSNLRVSADHPHRPQGLDSPLFAVVVPLQMPEARSKQEAPLGWRFRQRVRNPALPQIRMGPDDDALGMDGR